MSTFLQAQIQRVISTPYTIGEAECIRDRIKNHLAKDFWNHITFFITKDENLTKAHIRYVEGRLIEIAKSADCCVVMNNQCSGSKLPESDREDMEVSLEKMQQDLPVLGRQIGESYGANRNWRSHNPDCRYLCNCDDSAEFGTEY